MAGFIVMAMIGGFLLNLMPCVLPVVSIKILSFVRQAKEDRLRVLTLGTAFAAGIEVSFVALGLLIVFLGQQWGGLFQTPQVIIGLAAIVTAFALSLFGVFSINPPTALNELGEKVQKEGHLNAFGMGLLATVLGTACTAPFLSAVVAIAVKQPPGTGIFIFAVAGFGMAFPYIVLAAKPAWIKIIPHPGPWMKTFENVVGFCLLATVIWLLNPLVYQIGGDGLLWTLVFLLFVAMAAWFYGKVEFGAPRGRKIRLYGAALLCIVGGWVFCFHGSSENDGISWVPYNRDLALKLVNEGQTVFVDYSAEWCVNCKTNERLVLDTPEVRNAMQELGVIPMKADFTKYDPAIKADLDRYNRAGVPMYLILPAGRPDEPILLDEILTKASVIENLKKAGPSRSVPTETRPAEALDTPPTRFVPMQRNAAR